MPGMGFDRAAAGAHGIGKAPDALRGGRQALPCRQGFRRAKGRRILIKRNAAIIMARDQGNCSNSSIMVPLDYRSALDSRAQETLVRKMRLSSGASWVKIVVGLVAGLALTLFGAFIVASIIAGIVRAVAQRAPIGTIYLIALPAIIAWAIWTVSRRRGNPLDEELTSYSGPSSSYGEFEMRRVTVFAWIYTELLLWGPRTLVWAVDHLRSQSSLPDVDLGRAAGILLELARLDGGIEVADLIGRADSPQGVRRVLKYLKSTDWIDCGSKGRRVWLTSSAQETINAAMKAAREAAKTSARF
jgi:hypothetical protein